MPINQFLLRKRGKKLMNMPQLFNSINKKEVEGLYIFYGPEEFLMRDAVNRIKRLLVPVSLEQVNLTIIEGIALTADNIINACETLPVMEEKRLVIVRDALFARSGKKGLGKGEGERLQHYFTDFPDYTCLIIIMKTKPDMRTKLMKTIKENGHIIEFSKLNPQMLTKWITKQFNKNGKDIATPVLKRFIELTGYQNRDSDKTLDSVANEIKKILEYSKDKAVITLEDVEALAPENLDTNIFKLVDAVGGRDMPKAFTLLGYMKRSGEPPVKVLFMIARQFRLLLQTSLLKEMGYSGRAIASKLHLPPFVIGSLTKQCANFTQRDLKIALKECGEADMRIKSGKMEPWLALELLIAGKNQKSVHK